MDRWQPWHCQAEGLHGRSRSESRAAGDRSNTAAKTTCRKHILTHEALSHSTSDGRPGGASQNERLSSSVLQVRGRTNPLISICTTVIFFPSEMDLFCESAL